MEKELFETTDFGLATFLLAKELQLVAIKPTTIPKKSSFVFQRLPNINELIQGFWSGTEKVEPLKLLNAERELKKRLYSDSFTFTG